MRLRRRQTNDKFNIEKAPGRRLCHRQDAWHFVKPYYTKFFDVRLNSCLVRLFFFLRFLWRNAFFLSHVLFDLKKKFTFVLAPREHCQRDKIQRHLYRINWSKVEVSHSFFGYVPNIWSDDYLAEIYNYGRCTERRDRKSNQTVGGWISDWKVTVLEKTYGLSTRASGGAQGEDGDGS